MGAKEGLIILFKTHGFQITDDSELLVNVMEKILGIQTTKQEIENIKFELWFPDGQPQAVDDDFVDDFV